MLMACGVVLLLACGSLGDPCPAPCQCTSPAPQDLMINCSFRGLWEVPAIPEAATELYLQHNQLSSVPPGAFDRLLGLRKLYLHGNPWDCDCHIAYLRQWLQNQDTASTGEGPVCAQPVAVRAQPIVDLRGAEYSTCLPGRPPACRAVYVRDVAVCGLAALLLVLLTYCVLRTRSKHFIFTPTSSNGDFLPLQPLLKPRSTGGRMGRGPGTAPWEGDRVVTARLRELPLPSCSSSSLWGSSLQWNSQHTSEPEEERAFSDNMEILPQILATLHTKHNIKIKSS
uniref:LRRCT domain-containing protein n=1 Tax=Callorhinchus milii TaxID=7868 RepID=A0A4W3I7N8_CALMI|eukprot:gi/632970235/ref/XP_007901536.1/ PREDICTED: platelet glycoprotein IX-like isoform X2 [Callorhinchus milii]